MSFINRMFGKAALSKPVTNLTSHINAKEVVEGQKLLEKSGFKDIKITALDSDVVNIVGTKSGETYNATLNYATGAEKDVWSKVINDIQGGVTEVVTTAKGKIDGTIKSLRNMTRQIQNGNVLSETTTIENRVSGNHYKRLIDANGKTTYYKKIDGNFVELFLKR